MAHKIITWIPLCFALGFGLPGCTDPSSKPSASTLTGQKVVLAAPEKFKFRDSLEVSLNDWSAETGATVTVEDVSWEEKSDPLAAINADEQTAKVVVFPLTRMADILAQQRLAPVPLEERSTEAESAANRASLDWEELLPGLRERVGTPGKIATVLPVCTPVLVLYYRADLLEQHGLTPPKTWDEYRVLLESLGTWAPGLTAVEPWSEDFRATMFLARAASLASHPANYSLFFDVDNAYPLIDGPAFTRALDEMQKSRPLLAKDCLKYSPWDCRAEILAGRAALAITLESSENSVRLPFGPAGEGKTARKDGITLGFAPLPGSLESFNPSRNDWETLVAPQQVTLTGFAGLAVGVRKGEEPSTIAAWNLVARLWGTDLSATHPEGTVSLFRESQLADAQRWVGRELKGNEPGAYASAVSTSLRDARVVLELPVLHRDEFLAALTRGLTAFLETPGEPRAALTKVATEWSALIEKVGADKIRDSYRHSLGLARLAR